MVMSQCDPHLAFVNTCLCTKQFSAPFLAQTGIHDIGGSRGGGVRGS